MMEEGDDRDGAEDSRLTHGRRLALLEKWSGHHAKSLSEITLRLDSVGKELAQISEWKMHRLIVEAREEERNKFLQERLAGIENGILGIKKAFSKVAWIAAGTLIPAMIIGLAFVLLFGQQIIQNLPKGN